MSDILTPSLCLARDGAVPYVCRSSAVAEAMCLIWMFSLYSNHLCMQSYSKCAVLSVCLSVCPTAGLPSVWLLIPCTCPCFGHVDYCTCMHAPLPAYIPHLYLYLYAYLTSIYMHMALPVCISDLFLACRPLYLHALLLYWTVLEPAASIQTLNHQPVLLFYFGLNTWTFWGFCLLVFNWLPFPLLLAL